MRDQSALDAADRLLGSSAPNAYAIIKRRLPAYPAHSVCRPKKRHTECAEYNSCSGKRRRSPFPGSVETVVPGDRLRPLYELHAVPELLPV